MKLITSNTFPNLFLLCLLSIVTGRPCYAQLDVFYTTGTTISTYIGFAYVGVNAIPPNQTINTSPTVNLVSGDCYGFNIYNSSTLNITGGFYGGILAFDNSTVNISGGLLIEGASINACNNSNINISGGAIYGYLVSEDKSTFNVYGYGLVLTDDRQYTFGGFGLTGYLADGTYLETLIYFEGGSLNIHNLDPLTITTKSLPNAISGQPYTTTLAATGGYGAISWTLASGSSLPAGFTLDNLGVLSSPETYSVGSGTQRTLPGTYTFSVIATDSNGVSSQPQTLTLVVDSLSIEIVSVYDQQTFYLGQPSGDGRSVAIPLQVTVNGQLTSDISWTLSATYTSPITSKAFVYVPPMFSLTSAQCIDGSYNYNLSGIGGSLTFTASATLDGQQVSDTITCAIDGYLTAPKDAITKALVSGYGPLLAGLADTESSYWSGPSKADYGQFNHITNLPLLNGVGVSQVVGLMQIGVGPNANPVYDIYSTYWDWQSNTQAGITIFNSMLSKAKANAKGSAPTAWVQPSTSQIENWALALYKGIAPYALSRTKPNPYMYNAVAKVWVVNPAWASLTYVAGQTYKQTVNLVRQRAKLITGNAAVDAPGTEMP